MSLLSSRSLSISHSHKFTLSHNYNVFVCSVGKLYCENISYDGKGLSILLHSDSNQLSTKGLGYYIKHPCIPPLPQYSQYQTHSPTSQSLLNPQSTHQESQDQQHLQHRQDHNSITRLSQIPAVVTRPKQQHRSM